MKTISQLFFAAAVFCFAIHASSTWAAETVPSIERHDHFREIFPAEIKTDGWLHEFLVRQQKGLTGNYVVQGYPFTIDFWAGNIKEGNKSWWPYEQSGYLLDGLVRLGLLLDDDRMLTKYENDLNWVINNPIKGNQLGPSLRVDDSEWPMAVFFKSVIAYQLAKHDPRVTEAFERHFLDTPLNHLSSGRDIMNVEGLLRTYEWTGNKALLAKAEQAYENFCNQPKSDGLTLAKLESGKKIVMHGVTFCEELKIPVLLYIYTGDQKYLTAAITGLQTLERDHLLVDGVPSSNEYLATRDPLQSHETCDISDFTYSLGYFLMATGDSKYADMIERAVFNAGCGAVSKDFKSIQYFSSVNQVIANRDSNQNAYWRRTGEAKTAFSPDTAPMCCAGNVHRIMPDYAARMWMAGQGGGLVAALYGPSHINMNVGKDSSPVTVVEKTEYPFADAIEFKFSLERSITFPFTIRIPVWCVAAKLTINGEPYRDALAPGTYATIDRKFQNNDTLELHLPMPVRLDRFANALTLERGPLLYAYPVPEAATIDQAHTTNPDFPVLDLRPNGPWNYALDVNESNVNQRVQVVAYKASDYPLDPGQARTTLKVPVRRVKDWTLEANRRTPPLPIAYKLEDPAETLTLVPYGSTRLRVAAFPEAVVRSEIPVENLQIAGAYPYDRTKPISEQLYPPETSSATNFWQIKQLTKGNIYLNSVFPGSNQLAYVQATIHSKREKPAILVINAKDACEIWLNGKNIHTIEAPNQLDYQFPEWIPVTLSKGDNLVQLKVGQYGKVAQYLDGWGAQIRCVY